MTQTRTWPKMPPLGVADLLLSNVLTLDDRFAFWLFTNRDQQGAEFWQKTVLSECLPDPESELEFTLAESTE